MNMRIICNLRLSQLTYSNMRIIAYIGILCFIVPAAFAQGEAADENAIDLSAKMDTIARETQTPFYVPDGFRNVGLQNPDQWEDFELFSIRSLFAAQDSSWLHYGGTPLIFGNPTNAVIADVPVLYGDFDGDGVGDIIGSVWRGFYKGKKSFPYFDTTYTSQFKFHGGSFSFLGSFDFDSDGTTDLFAQAGDPSNGYILLYKGGSNFGSKPIMFADDSIIIPASASKGSAIGKFGSHLKPMIVWANANGYIYLLKQTDGKISGDSIVVIGNSTAGGIAVSNLYATDITGDGITDLIVSDNYNIYIFKGGDDFGTYQLTPKNAFYTIKSPRLTDVTTFGFVDDYGAYMHACGDLTGTGIPYLMVGGDQSGAGYFKAYGFLYAGGKALDSLYDGIIGYVSGSNLEIDTLHSINVTGKTACLINDYRDYDDNNSNIDFLMSRDCDRIPHKTNPNMVAVRKTNIAEFKISCNPAIANKFTKVQISSDKFSGATLTVFNLLGQVIQKRIVEIEPGNNSEFFNTTDWTNGTYILNVELSSGVRTTKFLVQH
jgi:hypothetical protein